MDEEGSGGSIPSKDNDASIKVDWTGGSKILRFVVIFVLLLVKTCAKL